MPAMRVSPDSGLVLTRNVGSSSARRWSATAELVLVGLRLGLDLDLDDRLREGHRLEDDRVVGIGQRVAREGVLEADRGRDVARVDLVDLLAVVGVELDDAPDALLLVLGGVEDVGAGLEGARVDPEEGELAHERVGGDLEGERRERRVVDLAQRCSSPVRGSMPVMAGTSSGDGRYATTASSIGWTPLFLSAEPVSTGMMRVLERAGAEAAPDLLDRELLALEVLLGQLVIHLGDGLDHAWCDASAPRRSSSVGDVHDVDLLAQVVAVVDGLHLDQVDDALEGVLLADGDLDRDRVRAEALRMDATPRQKSAPVRSSLLMKQKRGTP